MPDTPRSKRWWFLLGMIGALSIVVIVLSVVAFVLRGQLNETTSRVTALEAKQVADARAKKVAEIATCYASARGRPQVTLILRGLAAKLDPNPRAAINEFIDRYEMNTPHLRDCDLKAGASGFTRKDFPVVQRGEQTRP